MPTSRSDPEKALPRHVEFPAHWEHLRSHRVGPFITQVVHRLPDGRLHIWTSRRHRKRLGALVEEGIEHDLAAVERLARGHLRHFHWWGWRFDHLSWWIGLIFILGSICFVLGTVPLAFTAVQQWLGWSTWALDFICFMGSVFFTVGSALLVLEALNAPSDPTAKHADKPKRHPWRWFAWEWERIDFRIATVQLTGAIIFNINCGMALVEGLAWWQSDLFVWTPSTVASCCFVTASYLGLIEVTHRRWAWRVWDMTWWINFFSLLGSAGFLCSSLVGYFGQGPIQLPQWWGNLFALMMGSWFFLFSTYLLVPEVLSEDDPSAS
ncbi:MAG: hypothetical protein Q7Q73_00235 [Verrucomicrobiota bacterium JB024]|nr:hypothetical protein [Verrucomicrobiota bacterium JB024]